MNYRQELEKTLLKERGKGKKLLLHSCCAPCSSHVLTLLKEYFAITVLYYNPNITERDEYEKRVREQIRFIEALNHDMEGTDISYMDGEYVPGLFLETVKGYEHVPEGGARCKLCFEMRLRETARLAKEGDFDYFATTLTVSPLKNAALLNEIGLEMGECFGVEYLISDFKKKDGYKHSIELSAQYDLYRQDYCGCIFSKAERNARKERTEDEL
ncbi:MAG: epoxyqueuosine reductase QueH [Lachnospiraceae bacterium]|nr:epoxyqueuosine reductase QueH [Lachnospiraceae bacterium]